MPTPRGCSFERHQGRPHGIVLRGQSYINVYVLTDKAAWKYLPESNKLEARSGKDVRTEASSGVIPAAALMIVFTVDNSLTPVFLKNNSGLFIQMAHATAGDGRTQAGQG